MPNFIQNTKLKLAWWMLNKAHNKLHRDSSFQNYLSAKTVGVIFNATQQETYEIARQYIQELSRRDNLSVKSLGFVDSKEVLEFYQKSLVFNYFSRKNLNWYSKPNNPNTQEFINTQFDILIDLSIVEDFPIQYIVGLSKAKFKVGSVKENKNFYDFMIQLANKNDLKYFIQQLEHYFGMIKKDTSNE